MELERPAETLQSVVVFPNRCRTRWSGPAGEMITVCLSEHADRVLGVGHFGPDRFRMLHILLRERCPFGSNGRRNWYTDTRLLSTRALPGRAVVALNVRAVALHLVFPTALPGPLAPRPGPPWARLTGASGSACCPAPTGVGAFCRSAYLRIPMRVRCTES